MQAYPHELALLCSISATAPWYCPTWGRLAPATYMPDDAAEEHQQQCAPMLQSMISLQRVAYYTLPGTI